MKTLKQLALAAIVAWFWVPRAYPQGTVLFNNLANSDASPDNSFRSVLEQAPTATKSPPRCVVGGLRDFGGPPKSARGPQALPIPLRRSG